MISITRPISSLTRVHSYSDNHYISKCTINDLLQANVVNWEHNRPPDRIRCAEIAEHIYSRRPILDWMLYMTYDRNTHTFYDLSTSGLLIPGIRLEGDGAFGATILEVELDFSDRTKGTITTDFSFTATVDGTYTAKTRYDFAPWPGGSKRVVTTTFPAVGFPTGGSGTGKVTTTLINNNPTPLLTDGVYYGTFLKAMQFSKVDSGFLYAANQGYDGITQYSVGGDTLIASDKNTDIPSVDSFAVFPSTSEIIAVVPQASSNNLKIYQNEY
jgi:hypothetical protein